MGTASARKVTERLVSQLNTEVGKLSCYVNDGKSKQLASLKRTSRNLADYSFTTIIQNIAALRVTMLVSLRISCLPKINEPENELKELTAIPNSPFVKKYRWTLRVARKGFLRARRNDIQKIMFSSLLM